MEYRECHVNGQRARHCGSSRVWYLRVRTGITTHLMRLCDTCACSTRFLFWIILCYSQITSFKISLCSVSRPSLCFYGTSTSEARLPSNAQAGSLTSCVRRPTNEPSRYAVHVWKHRSRKCRNNMWCTDVYSKWSMSWSLSSVWRPRREKKRSNMHAWFRPRCCNHSLLRDTEWRAIIISLLISPSAYSIDVMAVWTWTGTSSDQLAFSALWAGHIRRF